MENVSTRTLRRTASRLVIIALAALLPGCSGAGMFSGGSASAAQGLTLPDSRDVVGGAAYWGARYDSDRGDIGAAVSFAKNLRSMGGAKQAVTLLKDVVMKAPDNPDVLAEYGKALTAADRAADGLPFLARAAQMSSRDWTILSAYGVALDQTGDHATARNMYQAALDISPANPTIESNLAMSYVLAGSINQGETIMRRLVASPGATPQMRQNLAMISIIKGNRKEAENLAREDLSSAEVTNNMAVLQQFSTGNTQTPAAAAPAKPAAPALMPAPVSAAPLAAPTSQPAVPATPAAEKKTGAPISIIAPISTKTTRPAATMAPIADDEDMKVAPASPKNAPAPTPAPAAAKPNQIGSTTIPGLRQSFDAYRPAPRIAIATAAQ